MGWLNGPPMGLIRKEKHPKKMKIAEKQAMTKRQLERIVNDLFAQMLLVYQKGQKLVYQNPYGLTPEQVLAGFGSDAVELVRLATLVKDCLNLAAPGTIPDNGDPCTS